MAFAAEGARVEMQLRGSTGFPGGLGRCVWMVLREEEQGQIMLASLTGSSVLYLGLESGDSCLQVFEGLK